MPEEKIAVQSAEKVTEAPAKSIRDQVNDSLTESTDEPSVEAIEKPTDDIEELVSEIEPGESEKVEEPQEEVTDEVDEILRSPKTEDEKSKVQQRIDKLTAELKSTREELDSIKTEKAQKEGKTPEYTEGQLKTALKKAMEEGDSDLVWDIMEYRQQKAEKKLIEMYENEKKAGTEAMRRVNEEWIDVKSQYQKYADPKLPELFPGSRESLNLDSEESLIWRVANELYWSKDPDKAKYYRGQPGGQKLAVADAMAAILTRYVSKGGKTKKIERQLLKEKRKKTIIGEGSLEAEEKPARQLSDSDRLEEFISERRKFRDERGR